MTTEQRLIEALDAASDYTPSPDLWSRVVHSIEVDRRFRRTIAGVSALVVGCIAVLSTVTLLGLHRATIGGGVRYRIDWRLLEAVETVALLGLVAALGPAIRRFGRGYVEDVFGSAGDTGRALLHLLDVAYYLVFTGFVLVTAGLRRPRAFDLFDAGDQLEQTARRVGGLLVTMGLLHAITLMVLPLVALVFTATRRRRRLPRWVVAILVLACAPVLGVMAMQLPGAVGL